MNKKYRKVIIAGNWKMNMLPSQVHAFAEELRDAPRTSPNSSAARTPVRSVST